MSSIKDGGKGTSILSGGRAKRRSRQDDLFKQIPVVGELKKLIQSQGIVDDANSQTVGWATEGGTIDPTTGRYVRSPVTDSFSRT